VNFRTNKSKRRKIEASKGRGGAETVVRKRKSVDKTMLLAAARRLEEAKTAEIEVLLAAACCRGQAKWRNMAAFSG